MAFHLGIHCLPKYLFTGIGDSTRNHNMNKQYLFSVSLIISLRPPVEQFRYDVGKWQMTAISSVTDSNIYVG